MSDLDALIYPSPNTSYTSIVEKEDKERVAEIVKNCVHKIVITEEKVKGTPLQIMNSIKILYSCLSPVYLKATERQLHASFKAKSEEIMQSLSKKQKKDSYELLEKIANEVLKLTDCDMEELKRIENGEFE